MFNRNQSSNESNSVRLPGSQNIESNDDALLMAAEAYRSDLKWRRIFRFSLLVLFFAYIVAAMQSSGSALGVDATRPHTALVELYGPIGLQNGVTSDQINRSLRDAFSAEYSRGVVLRIDSPGGTPVQSAEINAEITRLRERFPDKPLHIVITELCASGGYFVAAAGEKIFANPASIVGSIGVRMDSFGFVDAMEKLGIERRTLTAGENKALLDPFAPQNPKARAHLQTMLDDVHQQFIDAVLEGRGDRLDSEAELFSGLVWSGSQAKELGLIDGFGSLDDVARDEIGIANVVDYSYYPDFFERLSEDLGVSIGVGIAKALGFETRMQ